MMWIHRVANHTKSTHTHVKRKNEIWMLNMSFECDWYSFSLEQQHSHLLQQSTTCQLFACVHSHLHISELSILSIITQSTTPVQSNSEQTYPTIRQLSNHIGSNQPNTEYTWFMLILTCVARFRSAPAFNNRSTICTLPCSLAHINDVYPFCKHKNHLIPIKWSLWITDIRIQYFNNTYIDTRIKGSIDICSSLLQQINHLNMTELTCKYQWCWSILKRDTETMPQSKLKW